MVNVRTHYCDSCQSPTLHIQTTGLADGEQYAILRCTKCGNGVMQSTLSYVDESVVLCKFSRQLISLMKLAIRKSNDI